MTKSEEGAERCRPPEGERTGRRRRVRTRWFVASLAGAAVVSVGAFAVTTQLSLEGPGAKAGRAAVRRAASSQKLAAAASGLRDGLPGVGARLRSQLPAHTTQVVVAYGDGVDQYTSTIKFFEKSGESWRLENTWQGFNGYDGWSAHKVGGDLKSPIGAFPLTDAGGQLPEPPGTRLPYQQSDLYVDNDAGFFGESLADAFDYVIAIGYNHVPGTTPMSTDFPLGAEAGTGVWLHVDHGGPTHGCVSVPEDGMKTLLQKLDPADHPMIVMGDRDDLASG